jgi:hypothetical protein
MRFVPQYQNWYCDFCRFYPFASQAPWPYYPKKKDDTNVILVVVVLIIIIFVILPIIALAVLFFTMPDFGDDMVTPTAAFQFTEDPNEPGRYTGGIISISDRVDLDDVSLSITDAGTGRIDIMEPLEDDGVVQITNGPSCSYDDTNNNNRIGVADDFTVTNGEPGDSIRLIHIPSDGLIAEFTLR